MAALTLITWPILACLISTTFKSGTIALAVVTALPYLFLPNYIIELPAIPDLDKRFSISIGLFLSSFFVLRKNRRIPMGVAYLGDIGLRASWILPTMLVFLVIGASIMTWQGNQSPIFFTNSYVPGLGVRDVINDVSTKAILIFPYFVAMYFFRDVEAHVKVLQVIAVFGVIYTIPILIELRFSPQLHRWIYGLHASENFGQHIRGGFRPMVFLGHGLTVGFFLLTAIIASNGLYRGGGGTKWLFVSIWIFCVLVVSKNLGAVILCLLFSLLQYCTSRRFQVLFSVIIASCLIVYPWLRTVASGPLDSFVATVEGFSPARAQSFQFRLDNETALLKRANEKPLTGWGGWGRSRIYDPNGKDLTVADGLWIITYGKGGWLGYLAIFGFLTLPVARALYVKSKNISYTTMAILLCVSANLVYLVPNATLSPLGLLLFGALAGAKFADSNVDQLSDLKSIGSDAERSSSIRYSRFSS